MNVAFVPVMKVTNRIGRSSPLGATVVDGGVNFSLFSRTASAVELLLFDQEDDATASRVIPVDPVTNRTYHYWHVFVPDALPGQIYGYRVYGLSALTRGLRFDSAKVLLDPYGRGVVVPRSYDREAAKREGDNTVTAMKSVVVDPRAYDWEGDVRLCRPSARTIIYEMHVRGFTRHPSSPRRGTRPDCTRWEASSATPGRSGTADFGMTSATSSVANPGRFGVWQTGLSEALKSTVTSNAKPNRALIL
jgi:pullulanase/glycogen debranching enzyme